MSLVLYALARILTVQRARGRNTIAELFRAITGWLDDTVPGTSYSCLPVMRRRCPLRAAPARKMACNPSDAEMRLVLDTARGIGGRAEERCQTTSTGRANQTQTGEEVSGVRSVCKSKCLDVYLMLCVLVSPVCQ